MNDNRMQKNSIRMLFIFRKDFHVRCQYNVADWCEVRTTNSNGSWIDNLVHGSDYDVAFITITLVILIR